MRGGDVVTAFHKVRAGHWQSINSAYRIESRGPGCYAILFDREVVAQAKSLPDAMVEVWRREEEEAAP